MHIRVYVYIQRERESERGFSVYYCATTFRTSRYLFQRYETGTIVHEPSVERIVTPPPPSPPPSKTKKTTRPVLLIEAAIFDVQSTRPQLRASFRNHHGVGGCGVLMSASGLPEHAETLKIGSKKS